MQTSLKVCIFLLSKADSNHHKQNQNLLCYHYTIGHQYALSGCKGKKYLAYRQIISYLFTFLPLLDNQQIVVLLTLLCQQVFTVDEVVGSNQTLWVAHLFLVQRDAATLYHLAHLTL